MSRPSPSALLVLACLAFAAPAIAQPTSHVLQNTADHVVLVADPSVAWMCTFRRVLPTTDPADRIATFAIPPGRLLVVTDVEWTALGTFVYPYGVFPFGAGSSVVFELMLVNFQASANLPLMRSRTVTVDTDGQIVGSNEQLTTGIVLAPGTTFCGHAQGVHLTASNPTADVHRAPATLDRLMLRGYLIDAN
jgi:hypothetical protein